MQDLIRGQVFTKKLADRVAVKVAGSYSYGQSHRQSRGQLLYCYVLWSMYYVASSPSRIWAVLVALSHLSDVIQWRPYAVRSRRQLMTS